MQILGLLGIDLDDMAVEAKKNLLLFRLALAIQCSRIFFKVINVLLF